ncbi:hypothetical protein CEW87_17255 [Parazoarcus communis]|uniref:ABC-type transport auxiliary lipoprotein component domain-containing protein n=1 Tax=Parazoarcus communis TaxID=41977 RepID=A0A2U8H8A8_9RHOO|nr:ABC-type transport auxiliary lipoprotein family protein [Parazoarcus communis]AWI80955.1 hypothetical protein CEW87_17255 [Parazoarcus communis]PKO56997.1 MAG: hypothetical protein CVU28_00885 [Betaproteobacteria bacterium HGW-Betaproteobacteria-21]
MQAYLKMLLIPLLGLLLAGCNGLVVAPKAVALYDLGIVESLAMPAGQAPSQIQLHAPSWLNSSAMQYRLEWDRPFQRRAFVESRWVANPSELLARSLDRAILGSNPVANDCRLRIDLDEFVQVFDSESSARVEIVARAAWLPARSDKALARKEFRLAQVSSPATAEQGVAAYRSLSRQLSEALVEWLGELDRGSGQGLNGRTQCRA